VSDDGNANRSSNDLSNNIIIVNQNGMNDKKPIHLNDIRSFEGNEIINDLLIIRYKKLFFVMKYSMRQIKANFSELLTY